MLDMFKRPTDPPEYYHYYGFPAAGALTMYGIGSMTGKFPELDAAAATLSGLLCIGGIGGLASQSTARLGAVSGQAGVALGVASTFGLLSPSFGTAASIAGLMGVGGLAGNMIAKRVDPTSLPQTVAAFHSLVGLAASSAAIGDFLNCPDTTKLDGVHLASIYLATVIGSVTFTGSLVAFGKLDGRLDSAPLQVSNTQQHFWRASRFPQILLNDVFPISKFHPTTKVGCARSDQYGVRCRNIGCWCCRHGCPRARCWDDGAV